MFGRVTLLGLLLLLCVSSRVEAADTWSTPFPGVKRLHRKTSSQNINVLVIDLCKAGISLRATAYSERGRTVSSFGGLVGASAAINGDFFSYGSYSTNGLAMSGGAVWPGAADHGYVAPMAIGSHKIVLPHHNNITAVKSWMKEIVSGHPTLLDDGVTVGNPGDPLCTNRHPRTALGISKDHKTMIWAVVDGRATGRIGMTCPELATILKSQGAFDAVNLDGGGSSTMWLKGIGVVNYPSDGSQRVVGNHLAVIAKGSGAAAHYPCTPACNGTKIIGADCGEGDCAKYGATCVDDKLGVRCVSVFCPAIGKKKVCIDEKLIGDCKDGAISSGDCSKYGAFCSTAGSTEARCVSVFCAASPKEVPKERDVCLPDGKLAHCTAQGGLEDAKECPPGTTCVPGAAGADASCVDPDLVSIDGGSMNPEPDGGATAGDGLTLLWNGDADPVGASPLDTALEGGCSWGGGPPLPIGPILGLVSLLLLAWRRKGRDSVDSN